MRPRVSPVSLIFRPRRRRGWKVSPHVSLPRLHLQLLFGSPRRLFGAPPLRLRLSPVPALAAGSMMPSLQHTNLASSVMTADESSVAAGRCTSVPDSGCALNLDFAFHLRLAGHVVAGLTVSCIVPSGLNCVSDSQKNHQLVARVGRINLWKQVQNAEDPVDFTHTGA